MKKIVFDKEAREKLQKGVNVIANATKITLGARGRNVGIYNIQGDPHITKDGVTVAKTVEVVDPVENFGVDLMKQVALSTNDDVGDGTTTSIVLAQELINKGMEAINDGGNPIFIKRGMDKALKMVITYLDSISIKVKGDKFIKDIATISANNDDSIGQLVAEAFKKVGNNGVVKLKASPTSESFLTHIKGFEFDRGLIANFFSTSVDTVEAELKKSPLILITDLDIKSLNDFGVNSDNKIGLFEEIIEEGRDLLIICNNIETLPITSFFQLKQEQSINFVPVKAPEFGSRRNDILEDIAIATGGKFISETKGMKLKDVTFDDLGEAGIINITEDNTTILEGKGDKKSIKNRVKSINTKLKSETDEYAVTKLEERLAKLTKGVAIINVGANSEIEFKEIKDRIEDALNAVKAAITYGVVAGGGVALLHYDLPATDFIVDKEEMIGANIVIESLDAPFKEIINNSGENPLDIMKSIAKYRMDNDTMDYVIGYDVKNSVIGDMIDMNVVDPVKVVKTSLTNAVSITGTLLTTGCVIVDEDTDVVPFTMK